MVYIVHMHGGSYEGTINITNIPKSSSPHSLFGLLFALFSVIDFEFLDEFWEILASLEGDDELRLFASSWAFLVFIRRSEGEGFDFLDDSVSKSGHGFTNLNGGGDGITQTVEFDGLEVEEEQFCDEDIESCVLLGRDLDSVVFWLDELVCLWSVGHCRYLFVFCF